MYTSPKSKVFSGFFFKVLKIFDHFGSGPVYCTIFQEYKTIFFIGGKKTTLEIYHSIFEGAENFQQIGGRNSSTQGRLKQKISAPF